MRKRNIQVIVCLNQKEHQHLKKLVKRSGLTRSTYLRHLINGVVPQDAPPPDYYGMMAELREIAALLEAARCDDAVRRLDRAILKISDAVLMPRKRKKGPPQSLLCGEEEQPRSDEPFAARGESDKRRVL